MIDENKLRDAAEKAGSDTFIDSRTTAKYNFKEGARWGYAQAVEDRSECGLESWECEKGRMRLEDKLSIAVHALNALSYLGPARTALERIEGNQ